MAFSGRLGLAAALLLLATGCGTPDDVRLAVTPTTALYDAPLTARVSHLDPHEQVTATVVLPDPVEHTTWTGRVRRTADAAGRLTFRLDRVIDAMRPADHQQDVFLPAPTRDFGLTVTLSDGDHRLASTTVRRQTPQSAGLVRITRLRPGHDGLYADLYQPQHPAGPAPAVAVWGGSEGGIVYADRIAALLAARGHPALAMAYFGSPGLPQKLSRIPVEYFARGVQLLHDQPDVDPGRVFVLGISRGSEAAALTALHYPALVHGVIDAVPSSVAGGSLRTTHKHAAWTFGGADVPFDPISHDPESSTVPAARFRFGDFPGRVLAICGTADDVWPSCDFADAIRAESPGRVTVLRYADAGHYVGTVLPSQPASATGGGGTDVANAAGRDDAWPKVLAFLSS